MRSFVMKADSDLEPNAKAGTTVYEHTGYDYGLARDDTMLTGKPHVSVTLKEDGSGPFFTVRADHIAELRAASPSTDQQGGA